MTDLEKLLAEATPDQLAAALIEARRALLAFKEFDDMPIQVKRPDIFELRVRRRLLSALAEIAKLTGGLDAD